VTRRPSNEHLPLPGGTVGHEPCVGPTAMLRTLEGSLKMLVTLAVGSACVSPDVVETVDELVETDDLRSVWP
jgi:hypothetical protein